MTNHLTGGPPVPLIPRVLYTRKRESGLDVCVFGVACVARAYEYLLVQPLLTLAGTFLAQSLTRQPGAGGARDGVSRGARGGTGGTGGARARGPARRRRGRPSATDMRLEGKIESRAWVTSVLSQRKMYQYRT